MMYGRLIRVLIFAALMGLVFCVWTKIPPTGYFNTAILFLANGALYWLATQPVIHVAQSPERTWFRPLYPFMCAIIVLLQFAGTWKLLKAIGGTKLILSTFHWRHYDFADLVVAIFAIGCFIAMLIGGYVSLSWRRDRQANAK